MTRHEIGEPAGEAGDSEHASRYREPAQHLHHAELHAHVVVRALVARGIRARDHLRGHRIRDHVLNDGADHHQHCAKHVQMVGASKGEPTAGSAGKDQQARGHQQRADDDVGFSLRAEDRHGIDEFPEHHLHGPRQREPDADPRELRGRKRQALFDPQIARDVDQAERAVGEIDHHHRHVVQLERP